MKFSFPLLLLTIGFTTLVTLGLTANFPYSKFVATKSASSPAIPERGPVRMIRFVFLPDGLYPRQMQVDQSLLHIALEDKTEGSAGLLIESVAGDQRTRVTQINRAEKHWRGRALVRLTPGRYVLSNASQPGHQAELIVNP